MTTRLNVSQVQTLQEALTAGNMPSGGTGVLSREGNGNSCPSITEYDFRRPKRISKDQICSLKVLHEEFARTLARQWTGLLGTTVDVDLVTVEQRIWAEYTATLAHPACFGLARADTCDGKICFELSPDIFYSIVDRLMGGGGTTSCIPGRPLTLIEQRLARSLLHRMMSPLSDAWTMVHPIHVVLEEIESNPLIVQAVSSNAEVVVFEFSVRSSGFSGTMTLCVPFVVIEPMVDELDRRSGGCAGGDDADASVAPDGTGMMITTHRQRGTRSDRDAGRNNNDVGNVIVVSASVAVTASPPLPMCRVISPVPSGATEASASSPPTHPPDRRSSSSTIGSMTTNGTHNVIVPENPDDRTENSNTTTSALDETACTINGFDSISSNTTWIG